MRIFSPQRNISIVLPDIKRSRLKPAIGLIRSGGKFKQSRVRASHYEHDRNISALGFFKLNRAEVVARVGTCIRTCIPGKRSAMVLISEDHRIRRRRLTAEQDYGKKRDRVRRD